MVKNFDGQALDVSAPFLELCKSKKIVQKQPEQFGKNNPDRDRLPNVVPDVQFGSPAWSRGDGMSAVFDNRRFAVHDSDSAVNSPEDLSACALATLGWQSPIV